MSEQRSQVYIDKNVLSHLAGLDLLGAAQWEADWQPTRKHSQRHMFIRENIRPLDELWHLHKRGAIEFHLSTSLKVELERYANNALKAKQRAIFDTLQKIDDISLPMTGEHDVDGTHRLRPFAYDHLLQKRVYSPRMLLSLFTIS